MSSPTARTLAYCKSHGILAGVVERYIAPFGLHRKFGHKVDLFGCIDVIALDDQPGVLGIQATSDQTGGNSSVRVAKIRTQCSAAARAWLARGNRLQVWAWAKKGPAGKRKLWTVRVIEITGEELAPVEFKAPKAKRRRKAKQLELGATDDATGGTEGERPW